MLGITYDGVRSSKCAVRENIHTHTEEGHWKFLEGAASKAKMFKRNYEPKLEYPEVWGLKPKKDLCGMDMVIFWNNTMVFQTSHRILVFKYFTSVAIFSLWV